MPHKVAMSPTAHKSNIREAGAALRPLGLPFAFARQTLLAHPRQSIALGHYGSPFRSF